MNDEADHIAKARAALGLAGLFREKLRAARPGSVEAIRFGRKANLCLDFGERYLASANEAARATVSTAGSRLPKRKAEAPLGDRLSRVIMDHSAAFVAAIRADRKATPRVIDSAHGGLADLVTKKTWRKT